MNNNGKGPQFEYLACQFFQQQGYFVRRSVLVQSEGDQDVTDIDILAIGFSHPFQRSTIVCDCKNKARSKPYERIFWCKGLAEYISADSVYVALPKANRDVFNFANKAKVSILTENTINSFINNPQIGYSDWAFYSPYFIQIETYMKCNKKLAHYDKLLRSQWLVNQPFTSFNISISAINNLASLISSSNDKLMENSLKFLISESLLLLCHAFLCICRYLLGYPEGNLENQIKTNLIYGNSDPEQINAFFNVYTKYANETIKNNIPSSLMNESLLIQPIQLVPPKYFKSLVGLVERAYKNPEWYIDLLISMDYILYECCLKEKSFNEEDFSKFICSSQVAGKIKACRNIFAFIKTATNFKIGDIWPQYDNSFSANE